MESGEGLEEVGKGFYKDPFLSKPLKSNVSKCFDFIKSKESKKCI